VPFAIAAVLGLIGGAVLDIYSSGLALLTAGVRDPALPGRGVDGVIMIAGTIYVVFFAASFIGAVPGLPDHAGRSDRGLVRRDGGRCGRCAVADYAERELFRPARPLRERTHPAFDARRAEHGDRVGTGHEHLRRMAELAGLPARPARARRQGRRLGVTPGWASWSPS
jgi:hypothetical protein